MQIMIIHTQHAKYEGLRTPAALTYAISSHPCSSEGCETQRHTRTRAAHVIVIEGRWRPHEVAHGMTRPVSYRAHTPSAARNVLMGHSRPGWSASSTSAVAATRRYMAIVAIVASATSASGLHGMRWTRASTGHRLLSSQVGKRHGPPGCRRAPACSAHGDLGAHSNGAVL